MKNYILDFKDGDFFFTCSHFDNSIKIYAKELFLKNYFTESYVNCIFKHPKKDILYSGHRNGKIIEWKINQMKETDMILNQKKSIIGHCNQVLFIRINIKHNLLLSYGEDGKLIMRKLYDFEILNEISSDPLEPFCNVSLFDNDILYIMMFNKEKKKYRLGGYTLNTIPMNISDYDSFLPIEYKETKDNLIYAKQNEILYVTTNLKLAKPIIDLTKKLKDKNINLKDFKLIDYAYHTKLEILICLFRKGIIIRTSF